MTKISSGSEASAPKLQPTPSKTKAAEQADEIKPGKAGAKARAKDGVDHEVEEHHEKLVGQVEQATKGKAPEAHIEEGALEQLDAELALAGAGGKGRGLSAKETAAIVDKLTTRKADPDLMEKLVQGASSGARATLDSLRFALAQADSENIRGHVLEVFSQVPQHVGSGDVSQFLGLARGAGWLAEKALGAIAAAATADLPVAGASEAFFDAGVSAAARGKAVRAMLAKGLDMSSGELELLGDRAVGAADADLRAKLLKALGSPVSDAQLQRAGDAAAKTLRQLLGPPREGTPLGELVELSQAALLMADPRFAGALDVAKLEQRLLALGQGELRPALEQASAAARSAIDVGALGQRQADYLLGDAFQQRLRLLPEGVQNDTLLRELAVLDVTAPGRATEVMGELALRSFKENAVAGFQQIGDTKTQQSALAKAIGYATGAVGSGVAYPAKLVADTLNGIDPKKLSDKKLLALLQKGLLKLGDLKALKLVRQLGADGVLGSVVGGASLLGLAAKGIPKDKREAAYATRTLLKAATNGQDFLKLLVAIGGKAQKSTKLVKLGKALAATKLGSFLKLTKLVDVAGKGLKALSVSAKVAKFFKALGPIGAAVGVLGDAIGIVDDLVKKRPISAVLKTVSAMGGVMATVGGVLAIPSGGTSAVVAGIGTAISLGATVVDGVVDDKKAFALLKKVHAKLA